jgi:hypothetical protein
MDHHKDLTEQVKHQRYIEILAEEVHLPKENVEALYDGVMADLKETAEIEDFVPVFAWRRTRALLQRR